MKIKKTTSNWLEILGIAVLVANAMNCNPFAPKKKQDGSGLAALAALAGGINSSPTSTTSSTTDAAATTGTTLTFTSSISEMPINRDIKVASSGVALTLSNCTATPALPSGLSIFARVISITSQVCRIEGAPKSLQSAQTYNISATTTDTTTSPSKTGNATGSVRISVTCAPNCVSSLAGASYTGTSYFLDGNATTARFNSPRGIAVDSSGNIYVADTNNYRIRKVTPTGEVTTLAGSGTAVATNGTGTAASFWNPTDLAIDSNGNLYVADNRIVRKVSPTGVVTTLAGSTTSGNADGTGTNATFTNFDGITVDSLFNVYVFSSYRIRKITAAGVVTTLAGSGTSGFVNDTGTAARFQKESAYLTVDSSGNLYVADTASIRKVTPTGVVTTLAGTASSGGTTTYTTSTVDGTGTNALLFPGDITIDTSGNLYIREYNGSNSRIRKITSGGVVTTIAGDCTKRTPPEGALASEVCNTTNSFETNDYGGANVNSSGNAATFRLIMGITVDANGNIYVADELNRNIRKITL